MPVRDSEGLLKEGLLHSPLLHLQSKNAGSETSPGLEGLTDLAAENFGH